MIPTPRHWCLETQDSDGHLVVRFAGRQVRLGEQHLRLVEEYLFGPGLEVGGLDVQLDLQNVECMASTALAGLARLHQKVAQAEGHLHLDGLSPHLYELLEVTQMHRVLDARKPETLPAREQEPAETAEVS